MKVRPPKKIGRTTEQECILSVYIEFPQEIAGPAERAKDLLVRRYGSHYYSEPHLTLYLCRFNLSKYPTLIKKLEVMLRQNKPLLLKLGKLKVIPDPHSPGEAFIHIPLQQTTQLLKLHEQILRTTNPLRGKLLRSKDRERLTNKSITPLEKQYIRRYGYSRVLRLFLPHITLGGVSYLKLGNLEHKLSKSLQSICGKTVTIKKIHIGMWRYEAKTNKYTQELFIDTLELGRFDSPPYLRGSSLRRRVRLRRKWGYTPPSLPC